MNSARGHEAEDALDAFSPTVRRGPPLWLGWIVALLMAGLLALVRLWVYGDQLVPFSYALPLLVIIWWRDLRLLWTLVLIFAVVIFIKHGVLLPGQNLERFLSGTEILFSGLGRLVELLAVATAASYLVISRRDVIKSGLELRSKNAELERLNAESTDRERRIARQNEELRAQSEELERQAEELRVANDELARREQMLNSLLELSRDMERQHSRGAALQRLCAALREMIDHTAAAAVLERSGDSLSVQFDDGPGGDAAPIQSIPLEGSLALLVMEHQRTAFLEDLSERPDLRFPHVTRGDAPLSVIAAPLWVRGQIIGTLELYSRQRRRWSEPEIAIIESLAAQASISIESAELFEQINQERRRFEAVVRTLPIGVVVVEDAECRVAVPNPTAAAMYNVPVDANFSPIAPAGVRIDRILVRAGRIVPTDDNPLLRVVRGASISGEEYEVTFPNGRRLSLLVSGAPIYNLHGRITSGVVAFVDISNQKRLTRELDRRRREAEEASERKSRFLAAASHDIRTPANAISLLAEVLRRSVGNPAMADELPELASDLQRSAASLVELVSDVLELTRYDAGKLDMHESEFSLGELTQEECERLQPLAAEKSLRFVCDPPHEPVFVRTDQIKLGRVIANLVANAIKFTEQGEVHVRVHCLPDGQVELVVRDTGIGMDPSETEHIFDEYRQLRRPERERSTGSGLGLAITRRLVRAMGGTISVQTAPRQGSIFTVVLPISCVVHPGLPAAGQGRRGRDAHDGGTPLHGLRVLLVEDHAGTRRALARHLSRSGAEVLEAEDGCTGLQMLAELDPHVLLLDLLLPDMDGEDVLRQIGGRRRESPKRIVVLTGDLADRQVEMVRALGADEVLAKPVSPEALVRAVRG